MIHVANIDRQENKNYYKTFNFCKTRRFVFVEKKT